MKSHLYAWVLIPSLQLISLVTLGNLTSLNLSFLIWRMDGIIVPTLWDCCEDSMSK